MLNNSQYKTCIDYYYIQSSIDLLKRCVIPEEYEEKVLAKKENEELMKKVDVFFKQNKLR